ncbi:MAG: YhdH/YhfP family quinone oxidoreductase [Ignavibacteriales bacterium]|nr:YhdH/YhfP family quinone oxidoreductase [Ignavibacteriales bacterium]
MMFKALIVEEQNGVFTQHVGKKTIDMLPPGAVLIRVRYSSLNYKDALSATGNKGVTKQYPHTPGIDASGIVEESSSSLFKNGDEVLVTGYDLGMNTSGGFAEYIRVPADWVVKLPEGLSLADAMMCGTAGFTAGLSLNRMLHNGLKPGGKPVLVTGATGGVGSYAVALLHAAGYKVAAASRKSDAAIFLNSLGADEIIPTDAIAQYAAKPLAKAFFAGAVDTVGGTVLSGALSSCEMHGSVVSCGLTQSSAFTSTVFPFIIRGVNLLGINSAETPMQVRQQVWEMIAGQNKVTLPDDYCKMVSLEELIPLFPKILAGAVTGRYVVGV